MTDISISKLHRQTHDADEHAASGGSKQDNDCNWVGGGHYLQCMISRLVSQYISVISPNLGHQNQEKNIFPCKIRLFSKSQNVEKKGWNTCRRHSWGTWDTEAPYRFSEMPTCTDRAMTRLLTKHYKTNACWVKHYPTGRKQRLKSEEDKTKPKQSEMFKVALLEWSISGTSQQNGVVMVSVSDSGHLIVWF